MIRYFNITNQHGELLTLELKELHGSGLLLIDAEGYGSPKNIINRLESPHKAGSRVTSTRAQSRTMKLTIVVVGTGEAEEVARRTLYRNFSIDGEIDILIASDSKDLTIKGRVESNEPNHFNQVEFTEVVIFCEDPYFKDAQEQSVTVYDVLPQLTFPLMNDSLTEDLIVLGDILTFPLADVVYPGDSETGVTISLLINGAVSGDISLYNQTQNETMVIDKSIVESIVGSALQAGDVITITTLSGEKGIVFNRGATEHNIINSLGLYTQWIGLKYGSNQISYDISGGEYDEITMNVAYHVLYEGV